MRQAQVFFFPANLKVTPRCWDKLPHAGSPALRGALHKVINYVVDGVTGLLAASDEDLSTALSRLIADPEMRRKMSEAAIRHARKLDWDDVTRQWAAIMEEAVARRRNHGRKPAL